MASAVSRGTKKATPRGMTTNSCTIMTTPQMAQLSWSAAETLARKSMTKKTQKPTYASPRTQKILSWKRHFWSCHFHSGLSSTNFDKLRECITRRNIRGGFMMKAETMPTATSRPTCSPNVSAVQSRWAFLCLTLPVTVKKRHSSISAPKVVAVKKRARSPEDMNLQCTRTTPMGFCIRKKLATASGSEEQLTKWCIRCSIFSATVL
mmetsp:Transcript_73094/g.201722  ORF Transcript_73094/g.201722 Transcript_73094/m.201722 type:complete len:207 (-) Transcript_73094:2133-2753(-)